MGFKKSCIRYWSVIIIQLHKYTSSLNKSVSNQKSQNCIKEMLTLHARLFEDRKIACKYLNLTRL